ncbi:MBL fold metallo-hydrolase [Trichlorobacter ammonificans]|uniref:Beta-lactamase domain protein n=1 Tax=Trichlorobacter ammonificans TaxID=2916410 RepID=A0ABM9DCK8_9BACT|nr:MBL fold metallo-hydrolase [Trichlorobacter ammonificans]CAH2032618.1 Beta-lactamase domain protein [Trichlorobacter ammonificans]
MIFDVVVVGPLGVNCIILGCEQTGEGLVVDPGGDVDKIVARLAEHKLTPVGIINTHGHFDHTGGNGRLMNATGAPLWIHRADSPMLSRVAQVSAMYGIPGENSPDADHFLEDGSELAFGLHRLRVIHTPGHTPGGCCLYVESAQTLISGDTLFADGVGRTDLPGGSHEQLVTSIRTRLFTLPDQVRVWPGHGPSTTIGHEKHHNPYLD